jgi:hypothetical protein
MYVDLYVHAVHAYSMCVDMRISCDSSMCVCCDVCKDTPARSAADTDAGADADVAVTGGAAPAGIAAWDSPGRGAGGQGLGHGEEGLVPIEQGYRQLCAAADSVRCEQGGGDFAWLFEFEAEGSGTCPWQGTCPSNACHTHVIDSSNNAPACR